MDYLDASPNVVVRVRRMRFPSGQHIAGAEALTPRASATPVASRTLVAVTEGSPSILKVVSSPRPGVFERSATAAGSTPPLSPSVTPSLVWSPVPSESGCAVPAAGIAEAATTEAATSPSPMDAAEAWELEGSPDVDIPAEFDGPDSPMSAPPPASSPTTLLHAHGHQDLPSPRLEQLAPSCTPQQADQRSRPTLPILARHVATTKSTRQLLPEASASPQSRREVWQPALAESPGAPTPKVRSGGSLTTGYHTKQGFKTYKADWVNQDASLVLPLSDSRTLLAVFDGHGLWGHIVSGIVRDVFKKKAAEVFSESSDDTEVALALRQLFEMAHRQLQQYVDQQGRPLSEFSGSTCTAALLDSISGTAICAHVGDSAFALIGGGGRVLFRSRDHVVDEHIEAIVVAKGGEISEMTLSGVTARRVCLRGSPFPGLAMARALGDEVAQSLGVSWEPEVVMGLPMPPDANDIEDAQVAAYELVESARRLWPEGKDIDDITAVVAKVSDLVTCIPTSPTSRTPEPMRANPSVTRMVTC
eukprot:CAMPEP_0176011820 /NCGR_PEP_ID=MMETSP0120_2-20121206/5478_1 /TAXON_ID=160619 /ORGANISM="Kryptoperidinium foliaceum, Strain CCMP 1326" /LENGTH=531 /DNA_ID=CAMNT_0017344689 /DNA_START=66 /DNA_END=1661 /DNA_ORIENTATION=-